MAVFQVNFENKNRQQLDCLPFSKQSGCCFVCFSKALSGHCISQSRFWHLILKWVLFAVVVWVVVFFFHIELLNYLMMQAV